MSGVRFTVTKAGEETPINEAPINEAPGDSAAAAYGGADTPDVTVVDGNEKGACQVPSPRHSMLCRAVSASSLCISQY
jgi:hypothetical protein